MGMVQFGSRALGVNRKAAARTGRRLRGVAEIVPMFTGWPKLHAIGVRIVSIGVLARMRLP